MLGVKGSRRISADRLLRGEVEVFELDLRMVDARMDALHEATHADLADLAAFPDIPLALVEGDARAMWGNR